MEDALNVVVVELARKAAQAQSALEAMQFAQAALNVANAAVTLHLNVK